MYWHYRVRAVCGERMLSRLLQVLETQRIQASYLQSRSCAGWTLIDVFLEADAEKARRVGLLLRRVDRFPSAVWRQIEETTFPSPEASQTAYAIRALRHAEPSLDPLCDFWRSAPTLFLDRDAFGRPVQGHDTEVRLCWTDSALWLLFQCQYESLSLRSGEPDLSVATQRLWENDVAEVFIASADDIPPRYAEFEVSPRGEWIDLQVLTLHDGLPATVPLRSGFRCEAHIEAADSRWVTMLQIPFAALLKGPPAAGTRFRMNLYRSQGAPPVELAWSPTNHESFHVPASFGTLLLID